MTHLTISATSAPTNTAAAVASKAASNTPDVPRTVPSFIRADEAYYWSVKWQDDVREAMEARAAGESVLFDSDDPTDIVRWLLDVDEDDDEA